jgi:hypothetical protein
MVGNLKKQPIFFEFVTPSKELELNRRYVAGSY